MFLWKKFNPIEHIAAAVIHAYARPNNWEAFQIDLADSRFYFRREGDKWPRFMKTTAMDEQKVLGFLAKASWQGTLTSFSGVESKTRVLVVYHDWLTHPGALSATDDASKINEQTKFGSTTAQFSHYESLHGMAGFDKATRGSMEVETSLTPFMAYYAMPMGEECEIHGPQVLTACRVFDLHAKNGAVIPVYQRADVGQLDTLNVPVVEEVSPVDETQDAKNQGMRIILRDKANRISTEFLAGIDTYGPGDTMMKETFIMQLYMLSLYLIDLQRKHALTQGELSQFFEGNDFVVPVRVTGSWTYPLTEFNTFYEDVVAEAPTTRNTRFKLNGSNIDLVSRGTQSRITGSSTATSCFVWALAYYFSKKLNGSTPLAISIVESLARSDTLLDMTQGLVSGDTSKYFSVGKEVVIRDPVSVLDRLKLQTYTDTLESTATGLRILGYSYDSPAKRNNNQNEHYILVNKTSSGKLECVYDSNRTFFAAGQDKNHVRHSVGSDVTYLMTYVEDKGTLFYYKGSLVQTALSSVEQEVKLV